MLTVFGTSDYYLCVNKSRPDLLAELNSAQSMLAAEEPNYLNSLSEKYYSISVTAQAFSQAEREWMSEHDTLRVGYLENYLPYSDTNEQGEVNGIVKDIIPAIMKSVGMETVKVNYYGYKSYDDMIAGISSGDVDVAFPVGGGIGVYPVVVSKGDRLERKHVLFRHSSLLLSFRCSGCQQTRSRQKCP